MGEELARNNAVDRGLPAPPAAGGNRPERTDTDSRPRTPAAERRTDPRADSRPAAAGRTQTEEKKPVGVAEVTPPVPAEPKKKQTRTPRKKKKEEPTAFNAEQITALMVSVSTILTSREGFEMFALSPLEAEQIATPLANMIAKSENLAGLGEHADAIALVTACLVIFAPKIMLYFDTQKKKKIERNGGVQLVREEEPIKRDRRSDSPKPAAAAPHYVNAVSSAIPSLA